MPCGKRSVLPAGSASRECPPGEAGVKGDGRDEGHNCQLNASSESCILAQLIITFLSFSVHLQAVIIRAVCVCLYLLRNSKFAEQSDLKSQKHLNASNNCGWKKSKA